MMEVIMPCLYGFIACIAIGVVFNIRGAQIFLAAFGGALGWFVYLICGLSSDVACFFVATVMISVYAEIMARVCKSPATPFLTVAVIPMVPGGGMYYTMEYYLRGETSLFMATGIHTLSIAGAIALGIVTVTTLVRLGKIMRNPERFHKERWDK